MLKEMVLGSHRAREPASSDRLPVHRSECPTGDSAARRPRRELLLAEASPIWRASVAITMGGVWVGSSRKAPRKRAVPS